MNGSRPRPQPDRPVIAEVPRPRSVPSFVVHPRVDRVDEMLDLQEVPADEQWPRILAAIRRLDEARGRDWRLKLLLEDSPETATRMPDLVARIGAAGLRYDTMREPGGVQGTVLAPIESAQLIAA